MSKSDFEYMLNKKIESGTLYHTAFETGKLEIDFLLKRIRNNYTKSLRITVIS